MPQDLRDVGHGFGKEEMHSVRGLRPMEHSRTDQIEVGNAGEVRNDAARRAAVGIGTRQSRHPPVIGSSQLRECRPGRKAQYLTRRARTGCRRPVSKGQRRKVFSLFVRSRKSQQIQ